jgi:hypothetical protein
MNIYIVTYVHKNYGSLLQAYALQTCLKKNGATPIIIQKQSSKSRNKIRLFISRLLSDVIFIIKPYQDYDFRRRLRLTIDDYKFGTKYKKLDSFTRDMLSIVKITNENDFLKTIDNNSVFIAGSDQIWNSTENLSWFSFKWVKSQNFKYSYAASLGVSTLNNDDLKLYIDALSSLEMVSLREKQAFSIFKPIFQNKVRQDLDPTLLVDKIFWRKKESPRLVSEPYVFVYRLRPNEDVFELARRVAKEKKYKIVYTGSYAYRAKDVQTIYDAGVEDFLSYIDHAEAVITNSFHGTAFSIIYEKPFLSVKVATTGSRAESLLTLLNLKSQYIEDVHRYYTLNIDYSKVNAILTKEREKSLEYIKTICSNK